MSVLVVGEAERKALADLKETAAKAPVDMRNLTERLKSPTEKRKHMDQMNNQSVFIPATYLVTFSIEIGHPGGSARHMSMSSTRYGKAPNEYAIWMICEELGFTGSLRLCTIWLEDLLRGEDMVKAVNVVQLIEQ